MHTNATIIFNFEINFVGHIKEKWQNAIAKRKLPQPTRRDWKALEILLGLKASFSRVTRLAYSDYFELCRNTKSRSNHPYKLQTKLAKLNCYKNSFFVRIIKHWNDLPINVFNFRDCPNVSKFKLRLKNHMNVYWMAILYLFMILICFSLDFFIFLVLVFV